MPTAGMRYVERTRALDKRTMRGGALAHAWIAPMLSSEAGPCGYARARELTSRATDGVRPRASGNSCDKFRFESCCGQHTAHHCPGNSGAADVLPSQIESRHRRLGAQAA
jgi:hypothetical protein